MSSFAEGAGTVAHSHKWEGKRISLRFQSGPEHPQKVAAKTCTNCCCVEEQEKNATNAPTINGRSLNALPRSPPREGKVTVEWVAISPRNQSRTFHLISRGGCQLRCVVVRSLIRPRRRAWEDRDLSGSISRISFGLLGL